MNKKVIVERVLVIGIVSLLTTGIILSSNWNYFIQNNNKNNISLNSYQISAHNSYKNYENENESIIFQINILKSAIQKNNFMFQKYNKVFEHNITYVQVQKSSIKSKINQANLSIKHEIDILNTMKNIIHNHPYNYLKFFHSNNYTIPEIVSQSNANITSSLDNIETYTSNKNESNSNVNSIAYQSEEAAVGIGGISSIISGSNKLIFSKTNFNYNNIFYFSNNSNSLTTLNEFKNTLNQTNSKDTTIQNQFINSGKINKNIKKIGNDNELSFTKAFSYLSFIGNKQSLMNGGYVGGAALISSVIGIGYFVYRYKKIVNKSKNNTEVVPNPQSSFVENTDGVVSNPSTWTNNSQSGILDNTTSSGEGAINSSQAGIEKTKYTLLSEAIAAEQEEAGKQKYVENNAKTDRIQTEGKGAQSKTDREQNKAKQEQVKDRIAKERIDEELYRTEARNELRPINLDVMNDDTFFHELYVQSIYKESMTFESFKSIVSSFLYQRELGGINKVYDSSIKNIIGGFLSTIPRQKQVTEENNIRIMQQIHDMNGMESRNSSRKTLNGWYEIPTFDRKLDESSLSKDDLKFIQSQLQKFKDLKNSMAKGISTSDSFNTLANTLETRKWYRDGFHLNKSEQFVLNEINNDMHEVLNTYINHLTLEESTDSTATSLEEPSISVNKDETSTTDSVEPEIVDINAPAKLNTRLENFFQRFENSHLAKNQHGGVSDSGVTFEQVMDHLEIRGYLK